MIEAVPQNTSTSHNLGVLQVD